VLCALAVLATATNAQIPQALDLAELESRGVAIGRINVTVDNVFDPNNPAEDKPLYRWANRVHMTTRENVVESILLFEPGDLFEGRLLEESARLLRSRGFVAESSALPTNFDASANTVDVDVRIRDSWSLEPELKLSRSGGENEYGIGITDDNLLGFGKTLSVLFSSAVDRDERLFGYGDANVGGSRTRLNLSFADTSDGNRAFVSAGRPFFALDTRWSVTGSALDDRRVDSIYDLGEIVDRFEHERRAFTVQGGRSQGLIDGRAKRWLGGFTYEDDRFSPSLNHDAPTLLPQNRKLVYPWLGLQIIGDDYREMTELNDMGRTEDISLGLDLFMSLGYASESFGSDRNAAIFNVSFKKGWEPGGPGRLLLLDTSASARREDTGLRNAVLYSGARYYHRNLGQHLFSASLSTTISQRLDVETQVLLGGDNDLRGYPLRYQSGERSAVLTLEQRFFTDWYPFRLLRVGYAVFFDAGRVWGEDPRGTRSQGMLYDLGVGLRISSPRSSGRSVVHVDLAFPLNSDRSIDDVQLIVEKKASF
jgi:hypothetical protein